MGVEEFFVQLDELYRMSQSCTFPRIGPLICKEQMIFIQFKKRFLTDSRYNRVLASSSQAGALRKGTSVTHTQHQSK